MMAQSTTTEVDLDELNKIVDRALARLGLRGEDATIVHDVLMYAQLRGNNQGLIKIPERAVAPDPNSGPMEVVSQFGAVMRLNGNHNVGMVVLSRAAEEALKLAHEHGIGLVGTFNTSSSTGAIGYYASRMAQDGYIGVVFAGSPKALATEGGVDPVFGTNPIAIAVPTDDQPIVLDIATASIAWFGLIEASRQNRSIPSGVAYDSQGELTNDPDEALKGAIKAFGGHKGAGLAMMVELLTGPLVGAGVIGDSDAASNRGNLCIAINPSAMVDERTFNNAVRRMRARIKGSRRLSGVDEILLPGERGNRQADERVRQGTITLDQSLYDALIDIAGGR
ncbi:MAG: Ldh family oxidoreductase [Gammaproteobacteria bacterium]|nr:Ldh family oxidoreductase [Gammaproteobacteria bacterium]